MVFLVFGRFVVCLNFDNSIPRDAPAKESCSLMDSVNRMLNVMATVTAEIDATQFRENVVLQREYDFVIVGSSPGGCVLANRLSEANHSVLLLEAGSAENIMLSGIPMNAPTLQHSEYNWNYATEVQRDACLCKSLCQISSIVKTNSMCQNKWFFV